MDGSIREKERMPRGAFLRALYRVGAEETALPPDGGDGTLTREEAADALARFAGERRYLLPYRTGGGGASASFFVLFSFMKSPCHIGLSSDAAVCLPSL